MDKIEILKFITEQTKDPILALRAAKEWEDYLGFKQPAMEVKQAEPTTLVKLAVPRPDMAPKIIPAGISGKKRFTKKDLFPNSGKQWKPKDVERAVAGLIFGLTYEEIGPQIGRSPVAVRDKHASGELEGAPKYQPDEIRQMAGKLGVLARRTALEQIKESRNLL